MSHYNAIVLIDSLIIPALTEVTPPRSHSADSCCSPLWRQHYAVPYSDTALTALDAVDLLLSPYWDGYDIPRPPGFPRCIGYDFYRVGGRWHGQFLPGYDPERDPRNQEPCPRCRKAAELDKDTIHPEDTIHHQASPARRLACDRCEGTRNCVKRPEAWVQFEGANIASTTSLPQSLSPYVIVTPDGVWHESDGHLCRSRDEPEAGNWMARIRQIIGAHRDAVAINLDCHF